MAREEIRISGFGGQGIILMGYITGKAATIYDNKNATLTQSYGPEARGGACSTQVIVDENTINYPVLTKANVLVSLSEASYSTFRPSLRDDGILIYDSVLVTPDKNDTIKKYCIPAKNIAVELGRQIVTNIVMLGFFCKITQIISKEAMEKAVSDSVPNAMRDLNIEAFRRGFDYKA